jgi:hypothetical protein
MRIVLAGCCFTALVAFSSVYLPATHGSGQTTQNSESKASSSRGNEAPLSEHLQTEDRLQVKLSPGQRKAVDSASDLPPGDAAIFRADGRLLRKGHSQILENAFKACKDLRPISDRCWLCKDDGTIICKRDHNSTPDSSARPLKNDPK